MGNRYACGYREAGGKDGAIEGATWDPLNPLNMGGVHAECPPQRVDHVLRKTTGPMKDWRVVSALCLHNPDSPSAFVDMKNVCGGAWWWHFRYGM